MTDDLPKDVISQIPIVVSRDPYRPQTFNEAYLGFGTVYSVTDYGEHKTKTDQELIDKVREDITGGFPRGQATKFTNRKTMRLCDKIVIYTNDNGYAAYPVWEE